VTDFTAARRSGKSTGIAPKAKRETTPSHARSHGCAATHSTLEERLSPGITAPRQTGQRRRRLPHYSARRRTSAAEATLPASSLLLASCSHHLFSDQSPGCFLASHQRGSYRRQLCRSTSVSSCRIHLALPKRGESPGSRPAPSPPGTFPSDPRPGTQPFCLTAEPPAQAVSPCGALHGLGQQQATPGPPLQHAGIHASQLPHSGSTQGYGLKTELIHSPAEGRGDEYALVLLPPSPRPGSANRINHTFWA